LNATELVDSVPAMWRLSFSVLVIGATVACGSATPQPASPSPAPLAEASPLAGSCLTGMVGLPGGSFVVGQRGDTVAIKPFCMDATEVTVDAYTACAGCTTDHVGESMAKGTAPGTDPLCNYGVTGRGNHPMNCVDWAQADTYCRAHGKRLPTEEEWEWAARGGSAGTAYPWGNEPPESRPCWMGVSKRHGTCAVGTSPSGDAPSGVHDLLGNVWEWTATSYDATNRIARGGGWSTSVPAHLGAMVRDKRPMAERVNSLGFRCAR
jgi:sulfatase modifying factor 1